MVARIKNQKIACCPSGNTGNYFLYPAPRRY